MNDHNSKYLDAEQATQNITRRSSQSDRTEVLADIYLDDVNISIWQRTLSVEVAAATQTLVDSNYLFQISTPVTPDDCIDCLFKELGANSEAKIISEDVSKIVTMFCYLFDLEQVGLRLRALDQAMCPKFHVDRVPCRLVTTYSGIATEWLAHDNVNRTKLGIGSQGKADEESGLLRNNNDIKQLGSGDVALLKGESWIGNEGAGLVHRSPNLSNQNKRLLLTLDFI